ncbi:MAG: Rrf2 family transcriptional regulator [Myxococcaceae bacterium]|jgi:Rrf2 family protein|nr:Rrf2 family transcriptional regulator [Myxococcaceae bacterium]
MAHAFQISRKMEYGARAMAYLASLPDGMTTSFKEIAKKMDIPSEFLAKILKTLVKAKLVRSTRGAHGGYALARSASTISFLDVIEALEGPVNVNICTASDHDGCAFTGACTMYSVWRTGQERMLEVYRATKFDRLAMRSLRHESPVLKARPKPPSSSAPRA